MTEAVSCPCEDFEPVEPEGGPECVCGHRFDEHGPGFWGLFRRCQIVEIER